MLKKGFTLIELIVVIVIIGVIAGIAIPRFTRTMERTYAAEAIKVLSALREAQEVYFGEHGVYAGSGQLADLDVSVPALTYFKTPTLNTGPIIASIERDTPALNNYILNINTSGVITCTILPSECAKIGF